MIQNQNIHSAVIRHRVTDIIIRGIAKRSAIFLTEVIVGSPARKIVSKNIGPLHDPLFAPITRQLEAYLNGSPIDLSAIPIHLEGFSQFQFTVLQAARRIPYGTVWSYSALAKAAGYPRAIRAVASVMRKNPLPLVIPCHRVIRKDGSPGGYGGDHDGEDAALKQSLLTLEKEAL